MARVLRTPLLHFLVIGALLLVARSWWQPEEGPRIVVDVGPLVAAWTDEHGASPGEAAEDALVRNAIDEEVLYREALARGFDRRDETIRERLVRLGGFIGEETGRDRAALEREARRLGLERSDLVVRRHLVEMMRLTAGWLPPDDVPAEAELEAYLRGHAADFARPARVRLTHVYLSADARGAAVDAQAQALLGTLRTERVDPAAAAGRGDAFIHGAQIAVASADLDRIFGPGFADAVAAAPIARWSGPLRSSYGVHLVWVHAREPVRIPPLAEVRGRVLHRWLRERSAEREREAMATMRTRYVVEVTGR